MQALDEKTSARDNARAMVGLAMPLDVAGLETERRRAEYVRSWRYVTATLARKQDIVLNVQTCTLNNAGTQMLARRATSVRASRISRCVDDERASMPMHWREMVALKTEHGERGLTVKRKANGPFHGHSAQLECLHVAAAATQAGTAICKP